MTMMMMMNDGDDDVIYDDERPIELTNLHNHNCSLAILLINNDDEFNS